MSISPIKRLTGSLALAAGLLALSATGAHAVPAFAKQTGEPCQACHVGGFGPQLTAAGREFKLRGYIQRTGTYNLPISAMAVASYVNTGKAQNPPATDYASNNNVALDQFSVFVAGGLGDHLGAFIQTTYDGVARAWHWDNLDVRATTSVPLKGHDVLIGASLNNSPTVQDAWNTLPGWGYPYTNSTLAPAPSASPLLNGALAQTSLGATAYAWIDTSIYVEGGGYGSPGATSLARLGVDPTDPGSINGLAPYGRIAYQASALKGIAEIGAFGMDTRINPGLDRTTGLTDRYSDLGLDGSYILTRANGDVFTLNGRYLHEHQNLAATCALSGLPAGCASVGLTDARADGSYYWANRIGVTLALFDTRGTANPTIYAANRTFTPNSSGATVQLDGTLFGTTTSRFNTRIGVQYTAYNRFNGAARNFDGMGGNASDNNTFRLFAWMAY